MINTMLCYICWSLCIGALSIGTALALGAVCGLVRNPPQLGCDNVAATWKFLEGRRKH